LKIGHGAATFAKHGDDFLKETAARVLRLSARVDRVVAMLPDDEDTVHSQFGAAKRQRFADAGEDRHARLRPPTLG